MRIAVGGIHIECSTFNPVLTHEDEFRTVEGDALLAAPYFQFLKDYPATFLPTLHARAILGLPVDATQREPAASAVIYGGMDAQGVAFEGVAEALSVPTADLRLFGKPEAYERRRMGVATARGADMDEARERAREAAGRVKVVPG